MQEDKYGEPEKFTYDTTDHKWYVTLNGKYSREHLVSIIQKLNYSTDKRNELGREVQTLDKGS